LISVLNLELAQATRTSQATNACAAGRVRRIDPCGQSVGVPAAQAAEGGGSRTGCPYRKRWVVVNGVCVCRHLTINPL